MPLRSGVVGYLDWSFASKRHFGQVSEDVKKTRIVKLCSQIVNMNMKMVLGRLCNTTNTKQPIGTQ